MHKSLYLSPLTRTSLEQYLPTALALEEASGLPAWKAENFRIDLPEKWKLSRWVFNPKTPEQPIGYAVVSRKAPQNIHLHRFVVAPTGQGYGTHAMHALIDEMRAQSSFMTVNTIPGDTRAQKFYEQIGFVLLMNTEGNGLLVHPLTTMLGDRSC